LPSRRPEHSERSLWPFLLAVIAYIPSLRVEFLTDDFDLIAMVADAYPHHLASFFHEPINVFYRPLLGLSLSADYALWGLYASGYHLTNVILHACNSLLVNRLAEALGVSREARRIGVFWFAINPAVIGGVGWVSARADLLAVLFILSATVLLLRYQETGRSVLLFSSFSLGMAALLSKETGIVFIAWSIFLAFRSSTSRLKTTSMALAILIAYGLLRFLAVGWLQPYFSFRDMTPPRVIAGLFRFFAILGFPLTDAFLGSSLAIDLLAASALLFVILVGVVRLRSQPFVTSLVLFALSLAPALPVLGGPRSLYHSRHYYLPCVAASFLIGMLTAPVAAWLPKQARRGLAIVSIAYLLGCLQLNLHHWTRNSQLAREITRVVAVRASTLPPGTWLYVTGYRDMEGPFFPFHGNTVQQAVHLFHPETSSVRVQCVGQNPFCVSGPPPAGSPVLDIAVRDWQVTEASYQPP